MQYISIFFSYIFISNFIFAQFFGLCPFIGVSKRLNQAAGMGIAVTFVMALASIVTWAVNYFILLPLGLVYLQTLAFILIIAALVQLVEMAIKKYAPPLYNALGIYLPLITTNCAVLGVTLLNVSAGSGALASLCTGIAGGLGFWLAIILMAATREQIENSAIPAALKGTPIAFISGGLMAMAFMAFDATLLNNLFNL